MLQYSADRSASFAHTLREKGSSLGAGDSQSIDEHGQANSKRARRTRKTIVARAAAGAGPRGGGSSKTVAADTPKAKPSSDVAGTQSEQDGADTAPVPTGDTGVVAPDVVQGGGAAGVEDKVEHELAQLVNDTPVPLDFVSLNTRLTRGADSPHFQLVPESIRPGASPPLSQMKPGVPDTNARVARAADRQQPKRSTEGDVALLPAGTRGESRQAIAAHSADGEPSGPEASDSEPQQKAGTSAATSKDVHVPAPQATTQALPDSPVRQAEALAATPAAPNADSDRSIVSDAATDRGDALLARLVPESRESGSAKPKPAPDADFRRAFEAQVQRGIEQAATQAASSSSMMTGAEAASGQVTLRLHPANLGFLRVTLRMDAAGGEGGRAGTVRARFESSNSRTRSILDGSISGLRQALEDRGLKVDEVVVSDMPRLPERDIGLPPLPHQREAGADAAQGFGTELAKDQSFDAHNPGASSGGARFGSSAESGGVGMDEAGRWGGGEQPVMFAASPSAPLTSLTVGLDGSIRLDALV